MKEMATRTGQESGHAVLPLAGALTIYMARQVKEKLVDALGKSGQLLEVNLAGVTEIDLAGLQLLLMIKQEAQDNGKQCVFSGHSSVVHSIAVMLQVSELMDAMQQGGGQP